MNPRHRTFHVYLYADADNAEVGFWCDNCLAPAKVRFPVLAISMEGVGPAGSMEVCVDCGGDDEDDDAPEAEGDLSRR